jgi:rhodanese-related sulfurtransferase
MKKFLLLSMLFMATTAQAEIVDIGNDELKRLVAQGVKVVDVRTAGEWKESGVLAGSQMITLFDERGQSNPAAWQSEVDADSGSAKPVVLICRTGRRSLAAAKILSEASPARKIYNVRDGIGGWVRGGQSVVPYQQNLKTAGVRCAPNC